MNEENLRTKKTNKVKKYIKKLRWKAIRECRKAKEKTIQEKCVEINENLVLGKVDAAYMAIKRNFQEENPKSKNIRVEGVHIILNENEQPNRWKEYLEKLYGEEKTMNTIEEEESVDENELEDPHTQIRIRDSFEKQLKIIEHPE